MFRPEVWSTSLLPYLSDDEIVTKLWMSAPVMQKLIIQHLTSLVVNVCRISSGPHQEGNACNYYAYPPFLPLLDKLQYLSIIVPDYLRIWANQINGPLAFPSSLRWLETNCIGIFDTRFLKPGEQRRTVSVLGWMCNNSDVTLGATLSGQFNSDFSLTVPTWRDFVKHIEDNTPIPPLIANMIRHLTYLPDRVRITLSKLDPAVWESPDFKSLAQQITSCSVHITNVSDAMWLALHFPNIVRLRGWSALLPSSVTSFARSTPQDYTVPEINAANITPPFTANLTTIVINTYHGAWPLCWPEGLLSLNVTVDALDLTAEQFRTHMDSLPRHLNGLCYLARCRVPGNWWDLKTMSNLPRTLKMLDVPDLPNGWKDEELAILTELPAHLTTLHTNQHKQVPGPTTLDWMHKIPTAVWKILPVGITSLSICTREMLWPTVRPGMLLWDFKSTDLSPVLARFPQLSTVNILVIALSDPLPSFPDSVKIISIKYNNLLNYSPSPCDVRFEDVRWPLLLKSVIINGSLSGSNIFLAGLGSLPDSVETLVVKAHSTDKTVIMDLPKRWPKRLSEVKILSRNAGLLVSGVITRCKEHLPDTSKVRFSLNNESVTYHPLTGKLDSCDLPPFRT